MESSTAVTTRMCREVMEDTIKGEGCVTSLGGEERGNEWRVEGGRRRGEGEGVDQCHDVSALSV